MAEALGGARRNGDGYMCRCPAHDDKTPSLSVDDADGGKVLVRCFAGCEQSAVIAALKTEGLWHDNGRVAVGIQAQHAPVTTLPKYSPVPFPRSRAQESIRDFTRGAADVVYDYHDAAGAVVFRVARWNLPNQAKTFRPYTWDGARIQPKGHPAPRPMFNLPAVLAKPTARILWVEGEKCAQRVAPILGGYVVVTNSGGANGVAGTDWEPLRGRKVDIWPDADDPGRKAAYQLADILVRIGCTVRILDVWSAGKSGGWDVADAVSDGMDSGALKEFARDLWQSPGRLPAIALQPLPAVEPPQGAPAMPEAADPEAATRCGTSGIAAPEALTLEQMLGRFVHVSRGPLIVDRDNTYRRLRPTEFKATFGHLAVIEGKAMVAMTKRWECSAERQTADALSFHPGAEMFFVEHGLRHLNLWIPPSWPDVELDLASPFFAHLEYLIPDSTARNDFLDWIAHAVQEPAIRPHFHFLFVAAQEGTGRSWLAEVFARLWGERHAGQADLHRLLDSEFNSALSGKVFMAVQEVRAPTNEKYSHRDRLKSLLTDSVLVVNEKHLSPWTERFCARFLMFTNRDDALPLSESDRRVYVVRCVEQPKEEGYYRTLYGRLSDPVFLAAVWHSLRARNLEHFSPGRRAPLNEIKEQMIASGRTEEQQTAIDVISGCPYAVVASDDLMRALVPDLEGESLRDHRGRLNAVVQALKEVGKQTARRKLRLDRRVTRVWVLKDTATWLPATSAVLSEAAMDARGDFQRYNYSADDLIEAWRLDQGIE